MVGNFVKNITFPASCLERGRLFLWDVGESSSIGKPSPRPEGRALGEAGVGRDGLATIHPIHDVEVAHLVGFSRPDVGRLASVINLQIKKKKNVLFKSKISRVFLPFFELSFEIIAPDRT